VAAKKNANAKSSNLQPKIGVASPRPNWQWHSPLAPKSVKPFSKPSVTKASPNSKSPTPATSSTSLRASSPKPRRRRLKIHWTDKITLVNLFHIISNYYIYSILYYFKYIYNIILLNNYNEFKHHLPIRRQQHRHLRSRRTSLPTQRPTPPKQTRRLLAPQSRSNLPQRHLILDLTRPPNIHQLQPHGNHLVIFQSWSTRRNDRS
jgi:hypothetical protein